MPKLLGNKQNIIEIVNNNKNINTKHDLNIIEKLLKKMYIYINPCMYKLHRIILYFKQLSIQYACEILSYMNI